MRLLVLLGVCSPAGSVLGALTSALASRRFGRDLADDTLRGAGLGGIAGAGLAWVLWLSEQVGEG
ncbi:MAG: hypothetical protein H0V22_03455 [Solirubrobacterales bacterium]|nr:hypothetical protein [Solirubrobacterales bacterium]